MIKNLLLSGLAAATVMTAGATDFITSTPEGQLKSYMRSSEGFIGLVDFALLRHDSGSKVDLVFADDNVVYMNFPMNQLNTQGWLQGTIEGNEITFELPQPVYEQDGFVYEAMVFDYTGEVTDEAPAFVGTDAYEAAEDQDYKFIIDGDKITSAVTDYSKILGLGMDFGIVMWAGFGDWRYEMTLFDYPAAVAPEGLPTEPYAFNNGGLGGIVNIGVDDADQVWAQGLSYDSPEGWIRGTRLGDKYVFASGQYSGVLSEPNKIPHYAFIYGAEKVDGATEFLPELTFTFDPEAKTLACESALVVNRGTSAEENICVWADKPVLTFQANAGQCLKPSNPADVEMNAGVLSFEMYQTAADGGIIPVKDLYYRLWIDDQPYTLYEYDYEYLGVSELTDVPMTFSDYFDILVQGSYHEIFIYAGGYTKFGVQAVCKVGDQEQVSDIVYTDGSITSALAVTPAEPTAAPIESYDLMGRRVRPAAPGLYIQRTSGATRKVVVR